LTTIAVIGGGIAGSSFLFTLAREKLPYQRILHFTAPDFARPCTLSSTAIAAARGVSAGHSALGDALVQGFAVFAEHVQQDRPQGVYPITQYTGALNKLDQFKRRYPGGQVSEQAGAVRLKHPVYCASEAALLIDPPLYLEWLKKQCTALPMQELQEFVTEIIPGEKIRIKTQSGHEYQVDQLVLAAGAYNRLWKNLFPSSPLVHSKPVQGAYLEFNQVELGMESFSLTLDGDNLVYRSHSKTLLIGSTSAALVGHELAPRAQLQSIYQRLADSLDLELPAIDQALVRVGLREKASKREPYIGVEGNIYLLGGLYKSAYALGLKTARDLVAHLRPGPV
jgi:glycine/D-amino acid oxidase-like deaminating enzyme